MTPEIRRKRDAMAGVKTEVRWCSDERFDAENTEGVSPGGHLIAFGWWVIGTTIGGNAVVVRDDDPGVYFADHCWYHEHGIYYQRLATDREWVSAPLSAEGVWESLLVLAPSVEEFLALVASGEMERLLDEIG